MSSKKNSFSVGFGRAAEDYGSEFLGILGEATTIVCSVMMSIAASTTRETGGISNGLWVTFALGVTITVLGRALSIGKSRKISALAEKAALVDQLFENNFDIISCTLRHLAQSIKLGQNDRISVYKYDGKALVLVGRHAENPVYRKKGRSFYPDDKGFLGKVWQDGKFTTSKLVDYEKDPEGYCRVCAEYGMDYSTTKQLTMKSRSFAGYAIKDPGNGKGMAVIMFESTSQRAFKDKIAVLDGVVDSESGRQLAQIIDIMTPYSPNPSDVLKEGF